MKSTFGKIATSIVLAVTAQATLATNFSNELVELGENEPQKALGFVIGDICPAGVIMDEDLQDRCDEVVVAGVFSMDSSQESEAQDGMQAMAPEEDAVIASSQVDAGSTQVDNIGDRLSAIRGGASTGLVYHNNSGFNWSTGAAGDNGSPWGFFVNGLYVYTDRDSTSRESGFEADDWGVTGGIDYAFSDKFVFGVAFGYKDSDADIDANGGDLETDSTSFFAYWSFYPDDRWYVDAMAGYTDNDHDQDRNISYTIAGLTPGTITPVSNTAVSDTESDEISVSVTTGRNFYYDTWTLSPYGRIDYADIEIDGFTEHMAQPTTFGSGLALQIDDQDFESLMMTLGGSALGQWGERYFPQVSVEYVHEFKNNNEPITGRFVNDTSGTTFTLLTDPPDRNYFNVGAGLIAVLTDAATGFFRYQGLFGYEDLDVHAFEVGVRLSF